MKGAPTSLTVLAAVLATTSAVKFPPMTQSLVSRPIPGPCVAGCSGPQSTLSRCADLPETSDVANCLCNTGFQTSLFNCFVCIGNNLPSNDFSIAQGDLDQVTSTCDALGSPLPIRVLPGQNSDRPIATTPIVIAPSSGANSGPSGGLPGGTAGGSGTAGGPGATGVGSGVGPSQTQSSGTNITSVPSATTSGALETQTAPLGSNSTAVGGSTSATTSPSTNGSSTTGASASQTATNNNGSLKPRMDERMIGILAAILLMTATTL